MNSHSSTHDEKAPPTEGASESKEEKIIYSESRKPASDKLIYPKSCIALPDGNIVIEHDEYLSVWNPETVEWKWNSPEIPDTDFIRYLPPGLIFHGSNNKKVNSSLFTSALPLEYQFTSLKLDNNERCEPDDLTTIPSGLWIYNLTNGILCMSKENPTEFISILAPTKNGIYKLTALSDKCLIGFPKNRNSIYIFDIQNKKFIKEARLRINTFLSVAYVKEWLPKIAVLSDQRFVIYFPKDNLIESYKIDYEFNLSKLGSSNVAEYTGIISIEPLLDGDHFVTADNKGYIKLWNVNDIKSPDYVYKVPDELQYKGILCVRPNDGKVVYVTPETIGIIQFNCTVKYLNGLMACEYLTEKLKTFSSDNIQLIGEYVNTNKHYIQTIKQKNARFGLFDKLTTKIETKPEDAKQQQNTVTNKP